jgi:hypothetical protein
MSIVLREMDAEKPWTKHLSVKLTQPMYKKLKLTHIHVLCYFKTKMKS